MNERVLVVILDLKFNFKSLHSELKITLIENKRYVQQLKLDRPEGINFIRGKVK